jgi:hypothetical protein
VLTHYVPVPRAPFLEIKVRPTAEQKELFKKAAEAFRPRLSINQWLLAAGEDMAERQGFALQKKEKKGGK